MGANHLLSFASIVSLSVVLAACSDQEKDANTLLVESSNLVRKAADAEPTQAWKMLQDADRKLARLTSNDFAATGAAVRVASDEKIGGKTVDEIKVAIRKVGASRQVCSTLRTRTCAQDFVQRVGMAAARTPRQSLLALAIASQLLAAGLSNEAGEIIDATFAANPSAKPGLVRALTDLTGKQVPLIIRDKGIDAARAYIDAVVDKAPADAQADLRGTLLQDVAIHLDPAGKPGDAVAFVKSIQSKDRQAVAETVLRATTPASPSEHDRIDSLFLPLYPDLGTGAKKAVASAWANYADPHQHAAMMAAAETPEIKEAIAFAYVSHFKGDPTTAELNSLLAEVAPKSRWTFQDRYLAIAIAHRKDAAERARALAAAKAYVEVGNFGQVVDHRTAYRIAETLAADDFSDAKLDQLTKTYLVPTQEGSTSLVCRDVPRKLVQIGYPSSLPKLATTCLATFEKAGPKSAGAEHQSVAAMAGSAVEAGGGLYDQIKTLADEKGQWYPAASDIRRVLHDDKATAAYDALCADSKLPDETLKECRDERLWTAIDSGKGEPSQEVNAVAAGGLLPYSLRVPPETQSWKPGRKALFDRLIKEKPNLVVDYLTADLKSSPSDPAVLRLDADEIEALLPTVKTGALREMLIQSAILNHIAKRPGFDPSLIWNADNDATLALRLSSLLASGDLQAKDERASN